MSTETRAGEAVEIDDTSHLYKPTTSDEEAPATGPGTVADPEGRTAHAPWRKRVAAFLIDVIAPVACMLAVFELWDVLQRPGWGLAAMVAVYLALWAFLVWNSIFEQGRTGRTIGKSFVGIRVVDGADGRPLGWFRAFTRNLAHVIDIVPLLSGWAWPIWSRRKQTFSDMLSGSVVHIDTVRSADTRSKRLLPLAVGLVSAGTLVALAVAAYATQYSQDRDAEQTRSVIAQIAADKAAAVLSYKPDTVETDMAAAQTNLTGGFLEYYKKYADETVIPNSKKDLIGTAWTVVGTAVTKADPSTAEVLVYLNGTVTTGAQPADMISSIRLHLEKVDGAWLISDLVPL
ncbi:RDD family protein [Rhodococcus oxybenzonivorans]|nr:RDD family protein [Rhodococcus oxybenzonivorans]